MTPLGRFHRLLSVRLSSLQLALECGVAQLDANKKSRRSPPAAIEEQIRLLGPVVDPAGTARIYEELLTRQPTSGVDRKLDLPYGAADRHKLDVYAPSRDRDRLPVVLFFHGGGYSRGDKAERTNIGYFFARHAIIALIANYRLAPALQWPSGAEDVMAALRWAQENVGSHGGDPRRIFLMGESAGAAHVALAAFVARFHGRQPLDAAGVILHSGSYNVGLEHRAARQFGIPVPDQRNEAYFGTDISLYDAMSTVRLIDAPSTPALIAYAEYDPASMQVQAGELFSVLSSRSKVGPELLRAAGHGHISQIASFNTEDTSVSEPVLDFVQSLAS
jgi:triacylglycerol lipase